MTRMAERSADGMVVGGVETEEGGMTLRGMILHGKSYELIWNYWQGWRVVIAVVENELPLHSHGCRSRKLLIFPIHDNKGQWIAN